LSIGRPDVGVTILGGMALVQVVAMWLLAPRAGGVGIAASFVAAQVAIHVLVGWRLRGLLR
jgi:O-antigen/teichoic acid export membrane protein